MLRDYYWLCVQRLLMVGLEGPYGMLGIKSDHPMNYTIALPPKTLIILNSCKKFQANETGK